MFNFLRDKLKKWTEKFSKSPKESEEKSEKEIRKVYPKKTEIPMPMRYNVGLEKVEPDFEKLRENVEELEEDKKELPKSFFQKIKEKAGKVKISENDF